FLRIEGGVTFQNAGNVVAEEACFQTFVHIDTRILQKRDEVVSRWPDQGILEIDYADVARADAVVEGDEVRRMIIAQQPRLRLIQNSCEDPMTLPRHTLSRRLRGKAGI